MKLFDEIPNTVKTIWAKSTESTGYGVLCHLLDVAAVAEVILSRESATTLTWAANGLGLSRENVIRWISTLAGLHDFGKAIPGFQNKWKYGKEADEKVGLTFPCKCLGAISHDYAIVKTLGKLLADKVENSEWVDSLILALSAHHGYFPDNDEIRISKPLNEDPIWKETRSDLFKYYWDTLAPEGIPLEIEVKLPVVTWLAGLTSVADWIGSNEKWFPPEKGQRSDLIIGHFENSKTLAEKALNEINWPSLHVLLKEQLTVDEQLTKILGANSNVLARPLQLVGYELLKEATEPSLMIVEAPMGEGKTELAYLAYLHLQAVNQHRGLYLALPTQATGNAIFDRTITFLRNFSSNVKLDIQLVHGGAMLDERIDHLRKSEFDASINSSIWFSQRRRGLISPYGVGTIDQALLSVLNIKHHFVRLWGLTNRVVILDEVHAYDTYTSGLITSLLRWLKEMNCSVILMSATLPNKKRVDFIKAWKSTTDQYETENYPRLTLVNNSMLISKNVICRSMSPVDVSGIEEDLPSIAAEVIRKLEAGGCGVVILNTVQRAQDLYCLLKEQIHIEIDMLLFHARFPADERSKKEKDILEKFGKSSILEGRPKIGLLIATQVVEQSLDIDFDFMISDLAPVDLLLQRVGRLHRHQRSRPQKHKTPQLQIAGMRLMRLPNIGETGWKWVYDPYLLYRTWAWISREPIWKLPDDIDRFVQLVYENNGFPEEMTDEQVKIIDDSYGTSIAKNKEEEKTAQHASLESNANPSNAYDNKPTNHQEGEELGMKAVTRLGKQGITAIPVFVSEDGWRLDVNLDPFDPESTISDDLAKKIYMRQVKITRNSLVKELLNVEMPKGFEMNSLLKHLKPLKLSPNELQLKDMIVRLDPDLGITYTTVKNSKAEE